MEAVATAVQTLGEQGYGRSPPSMGSRDGVSVTGCPTNQITRGGVCHGILIAAGAPPHQQKISPGATGFTTFTPPILLLDNRLC